MKGVALVTLGLALKAGVREDLAEGETESDPAVEEEEEEEEEDASFR